MRIAVHSFYPIVDSAAWVRRLVPAGARFVQLRIKDADTRHLRAEIRDARDVCACHGATLVINDYWRLAIEEGCDFVHLGQEDLASVDRDALRRAGVRLGVSTHDDAELARGLAMEPDYVALGPIYETTLKVMAFGPQGLDRIGEWKRRIAPLPLVAIGGITLERGADVFGAGADCISVVSDVLRHADPEGRVTDWLALCARHAPGRHSGLESTK